MSDFPTKENPKVCDNGCGSKIYLSNKNEKKKWLPYELDGTIHDCPNKQQQNGTSKQEFILEAVQKKLESLGIIVNIERLMKQ